MTDNTKITVLAFTSKNQQKQQQFRKMIEESDILRSRIRLVIVSSEEEALAALPQAEVFLCYRLPASWLPIAKELRWIHAGAAGVNHILTPELVRSNIRITNARGIHVDVQSDYIIGARLNGTVWPKAS